MKNGQVCESEVQENDAPIEEPQSRMKKLKERENSERKADKDQIEVERLQQISDEEK